MSSSKKQTFSASRSFSSDGLWFEGTIWLSSGYRWRLDLKAIFSQIADIAVVYCTLQWFRQSKHIRLEQCFSIPGSRPKSGSPFHLVGSPTTV